MKERPILFSAPMVRSILSGAKTQTRRVCKPAQLYSLSHVVEVPDPLERGQVYNGSHFGDEEGDVQFASPYGGPGDRLWVKETWRTAKSLDDKSPNDIGAMCIDAGYRKPWAPLSYEADGHRNSEWRGFELAGDAEPGKTRVSIHMPRWASRITLEITGVRVERLQGISEADAVAEGVTPQWEPGCSGRLMEALGGFSYRPAASAYADLWEEINGPNSWGGNPWVWVVEFKRIAQLKEHQ